MGLCRLKLKMPIWEWHAARCQHSQPRLPWGYILIYLLLQEAQLAQERGPGMPPIRVVVQMPQSDSWGAADAELPFAQANDVLGVQLDRSIPLWVRRHG